MDGEEKEENGTRVRGLCRMVSILEQKAWTTIRSGNFMPLLASLILAKAE